MQKKTIKKIQFSQIQQQKKMRKFIKKTLKI